MTQTLPAELGVKGTSFRRQQERSVLTSRTTPNAPSGARSIWRYLVPATLAATIATMAWIVLANSSARPAPRGQTQAVASSRHHFWIVRAGQTLSEIASRTSVSISQINQLNPGNDLRMLHPGQLVRVRGGEDNAPAQPARQARSGSSPSALVIQG